MLFNERNDTFDSCTLTSSSELWLFLLSVIVKPLIVLVHFYVSYGLGRSSACVAVKAKVAENRETSPVDIRANITLEVVEDRQVDVDVV